MDVRQVSLKPINTATPQKVAGQPGVGTQTSFSAILAEKIDHADQAVKFSRHAVERIESRNLVLTRDQLDRIQDSVDKAAAKGAKESVLVMDSMALLVSIDNRTVITCVDRQDMKENIFTNVDSVAFL